MLFVEDKDIKVTKSNFVIYKDEFLKYEGKTNKTNFKDLVIILQRRPDLVNALTYEILNVIYTLQYATSRQITEYLNYVKNIEVTQLQISKKLDNLSKFSVICKYSFISEENEEGTNMKIYSLDHNGSILLRSYGFNCNWQHTDLLDTDYTKSCLIRNEFIIKLYKNNIKATDIKIRKLNMGIGALYNINTASHVLIPVRRYNNYKEKLLDTFIRINQNIDSDILMLKNPIKYLIIGEDVQHIYDIFLLLRANKFISENILFNTDLKLYNDDLSNSFVRFGIKKQGENAGKICMINSPLNEFIN